MKRLFVAGTDTGIGKTLVAELMLQQLAEAGYQAIGLKPVAAGASLHNGISLNEDALGLASVSTVALAYEQVNPCLLELPLAPHVAAQKQGVSITVESLVAALEPALAQHADVCVIEGAGGWLVPLNSSETMEDLALALDVDVVLVVGLRLGCINHALLSAQAIVASGARLRGWVANHLEPDMPAVQENIQAIEQRIAAPLLGEVPWLGEEGEVKGNTWLKLETLLGDGKR